MIIEFKITEQANDFNGQSQQTRERLEAYLTAHGYIIDRYPDTIDWSMLYAFSIQRESQPLFTEVAK